MKSFKKLFLVKEKREYELMLAAKLNQKIDKIHSSKKLGYAKISREKLRDFSTGKLSINKNTMNLLLAMSVYVDSTSRVVIDLEKLSRQLHMQRRTFQNAMREAKFHKLLYKKDGSYYSNFHLVTSGDSTTYNYISPLDEFTSASFLNLTLNQQRLLSYILTSSLMGSLQTYNIVKLYKNKVKNKKLEKDEDRGLDIFPNLKDLLVNLSVLINLDQIEVKLFYKRQGFFILNSSYKGNIEKTLLAHFGFSAKGKKGSRISYDTFDNEKIQVRTSKRLDKKVKVVATEYELEQMALMNNFSVRDFGEEQLNYFIGVKNELMLSAGSFGADIFRKVAKKYFAERKEMILMDAAKGKATNYFVDYYLLPEISAILSDAALHQNIMRSENTIFQEILTNGYILPLKHVCSLIKFFMQKGSDNHLLKLDKDLFQRAINTSRFIGDEWSQLNSKLEHIKYKFNLSISHFDLSIGETKDLLYRCAEKNLKHEDLLEILASVDRKDSLDSILSDYVTELEVSESEPAKPEMITYMNSFIARELY